MINRDDIEAGDKVYTRDGGCLVAKAMADAHITLGTEPLDVWSKEGLYYDDSFKHPLDIIRIEKAPKPVVEQMTMVWSEQAQYVTRNNLDITNWPHCIKLTIINGKMDKWEQVK